MLNPSSTLASLQKCINSLSGNQSIEVARQARSLLYVAFLDISKAYDSVDQQTLWVILPDLGNLAGPWLEGYDMLQHSTQW